MSERPIVRRHQESDKVQVAPFTSDLYPCREHRGSDFAVKSEVVWPSVTPDGSLRGPPQILLRWQFYAGRSGTIVGYRRAGGFGAPGDFGQFIIESSLGGEQFEQLEPGDYFYTFCIRSSFLEMLNFYGKPLRFSVSMPSIQKTLELMKQAITYKKHLAEFQKLSKVDQVPDVGERDPSGQIGQQLNRALLAAKHKFAAASELQEFFDEEQRKIINGPHTESEKKRMLNTLKGLKREAREKLGL